MFREMTKHAREVTDYTVNSIFSTLEGMFEDGTIEEQLGNFYTTLIDQLIEVELDHMGRADLYALVYHKGGYQSLDSLGVIESRGVDKLIRRVAFKVILQEVKSHKCYSEFARKWIDIGGCFSD